MNSKKVLIITSAVLIFVAVIVMIGLSLGKSELDWVWEANASFQSVSAAEVAGYVNVNVGECVASPEGAMGYHFVNFDLVDLELTWLEPEILVYIPDGAGGLRLGAVEYAVPIEPWDALYDAPPEVLGQTLSANPVLGLYVLHVWLYEDNPTGVFADWNPNVSCEI